MIVFTNSLIKMTISLSEMNNMPDVSFPNVFIFLCKQLYSNSEIEIIYI